MSFSDSDWTRDPPLRPRMPAAQRRALILAIAIAVSCLAIALAVYGIEQLLDASARDDALRHVSNPSAGAPSGAGTPNPTTATPQAAPLPVVTPASAAPAPSASQVDAQQLSALEAEMRQRARETSEQAALEAVKRKERAWQRFYQRPDFCADNPTAALMVQCANQYIRARKEFEERYAGGRL
jgi:hypothetical protein